MDKRCSKCGEVKDLETGFYKNKKRKDGFGGRCKSCHRKSIQNWRKNNPEKSREQDRRWRENNPEKARKHAKDRIQKWRKDNPKRVRQLAKKDRKQASNNLEDNYIKRKIVERLKITRTQITPEMIKLKRSMILLYRELKTAKEARKCQAM